MSVILTQPMIRHAEPHSGFTRDPERAFEGLAYPDENEDPSHRRVLAAAIALLGQGEELLEVLSIEGYTRRVGVAFNGSIGGHYRHCLDHFASLLSGCGTGTVDYDHRARDPRLEKNPELARRETEALRKALAGMNPERLAERVSVRCEVSYEHGDSPLTRSTLGRELVYAIAHGIHHFALIAVMARLQGVELPADFGVAPSTVAHRATVGRG